MQIYSNAEPLRESKLDRDRKLFAGTNPSHVMIPMGLTRGPAQRRLATAAVLLVGTVLGCTARPAVSSSPAAPPVRAVGEVDPAELARDLQAFAHDSMRGRETGTPDAFRAAAFIGKRLADLGLEPVGDSLYYQRVPMVRQVITPATRITVTRSGVTRPIRVGDEIAPMLSLGDGQPDPRRSVNAD